jgi:hypothetical protein
MNQDRFDDWCHNRISVLPKLTCSCIKVNKVLRVVQRIMKVANEGQIGTAPLRSVAQANGSTQVDGIVKMVSARGCM